MQGCYRAEALRFDVVVTFVTCVGWIVWRLARSNSLVDTSDRMFLCLPALRLFSTVDNTRGLVFGLIGSLPSFFSVTMLLLVRPVRRCEGVSSA